MKMRFQSYMEHERTDFFVIVVAPLSFLGVHSKAIESIVKTINQTPRISIFAKLKVFHISAALIEPFLNYK